ncbi:MAG: elongation factor P [Rhabdochlamydiaceae bacterium]
MIASNQITAGTVIDVEDRVYRVESVTKVAVPKGVSFIKAKLKDLVSGEILEKSFKLNQSIQDVILSEKKLEFLYIEDSQYLFLDINTLDQIFVSQEVIGDKINFLKEGTEVKAMFYGQSIFSVELPQFLELMIAKTDDDSFSHLSNSTKEATLETGGKLQVPLFIESGDIIKVDTQTNEYIQRV